MLHKKIKKIINVIKKIKNWPIYFLDYLKIINDGYIVYFFRNGQKVKVRAKTSDWVVINEIFVKNDYNPKGFEIINKDIVVDVGAQIGSFSILASRLASKVYSFEPVGENFKLLKENININKIENIFPFEEAVSAKTGKTEMFISDSNSGGHSLFINAGSTRKIIVPTISLKDFIDSEKITTIDFLKMDCEGSEYDILFSSPKEVLGIIKKISMEYHDINEDRNSLTLKKFLEDNGFMVTINSDSVHYLYAKR